VGSPETAESLDWINIVKKQFGKTLKWRSQPVKEQFEEEQRHGFEAYEKVMPKGTDKPFGV
jgi:hypothetical protein